jgi:UTP--glucose-1-phosphate uridylyltransferase
MIEAYQETGGSMVATMEVSAAKTSSYGMLDIAGQSGQIVQVKGLVEKPAAGDAPSNLAVIGRYILAPEVMQSLEQVDRGAGGEIQLTDAIAQEISAGRDVFGYRFDGQRFDCGSKAGFLQATVAFALARDDLRDELAAFLAEILFTRNAAQ